MSITLSKSTHIQLEQKLLLPRIWCICSDRL